MLLNLINRLFFNSKNENSFEVIGAILSDVGCVREKNEDKGILYYPESESFFHAKGVLIMVADGMGGHSSGELASKIAIDMIGDLYYSNLGSAQYSLKRAIMKANQKIFKTANCSENLKGMGTTCTALVIRKSEAILGHIGDSRLYLIRNESILMMSEDHSAVTDLVKRGIISPEEARVHPDRNIIQKALGISKQVELSMWNKPIPVRCEDRFLICSDGLYEMVKDNEIYHAAITFSPEKACRFLVALAKQRGGHDNITVGIVYLKTRDKQNI